MTELRDILKESGVRSAVVIDDVFDDVPRSTELTNDDWNVFIDDLRLADRDQELIAEIYPQYEQTPLEDLKTSDEFVKMLWEHRGRLETCNLLFGDYETKNIGERRYLDSLVKTLENLGLQCATMGTVPNSAVNSADLLIVDLYLGSQQDETDARLTVGLLKTILERRRVPPLVVLTSRSSDGLDRHRDSFRDTVGLLGSMYRVVLKRDMSDAASVIRLLRRLAVHYEDAKKIDRFICAWDTGVDQARERFITQLRRLDLSDLAQIRALMLEFEGQKLGEYLIEIADRVLQYEIEAVRDTIDAAIELNRVDLEKYPAPHLTGTADLQEVVYRGMFLHGHRLELSEGDDKVKLQFGDVMLWKEKGPLFQRFDVFLVVSPACDLARGAVDGVMLLSGTLQELEPTAWSYRQEPVRTPVVIRDAGRWWIKWDLKAIRVVAYDELQDGHRVERIGRLREIHATDLQQKMLAILGRVGTLAAPPVAFVVEVYLYYVGTDSRLKTLGETSFQSVCYVGRDADSKPVHRLVLGEADCDEVESGLRSLSDSDVHGSARVSLSGMRDDRSFFDRLERGKIVVPPETGRRSVDIGGRQVAVVIRNGDVTEGYEIRSGRNAALFIHVVDVGNADV